MRYAVVDTGSNTIRMSIYECENNNFNEIFTEAVFANLASYINEEAWETLKIDSTSGIQTDSFFEVYESYCK